MKHPNPKDMTREALEAEVRDRRNITPNTDNNEHVRWKAMATALAESDGKMAGMLTFAGGKMGHFIVTSTGDEAALTLEIMRALKADYRASRTTGEDPAMTRLDTLKAYNEAVVRVMDAAAVAAIDDMVDAIFAEANAHPDVEIPDLPSPPPPTPDEIRDARALAAAEGLMHLKWSIQLGRVVAELPYNLWLSHDKAGWWLLESERPPDGPHASVAEIRETFGSLAKVFKARERALAPRVNK